MCVCDDSSNPPPNSPTQLQRVEQKPVDSSSSVTSSLLERTRRQHVRDVRDRCGTHVGALLLPVSVLNGWMKQHKDYIMWRYRRIDIQWILNELYHPLHSITHQCHLVIFNTELFT